MFHNRPCGCKGKRTCLKCEEEYGAWNTFKGFTEEDKAKSVVYCPLCELAWSGWSHDSWKQHPNHDGKPLRVAGVKVLLDFVSETEESTLLEQLDRVPWDTSQSGRLKQNYGPKCNFKKRKVKLDGFTGYPQFTKKIQDRFNSVTLLEGFETVEQCSLDYTPSRGASIDPHIDDCWIWGERIPTLSLMSDSVLTLTTYTGSCDRYNLKDVQSYPSVVDHNGHPRTIEQLQEFYENINGDTNDIKSSTTNNTNDSDLNFSETGEGKQDSSDEMSHNECIKKKIFQSE
uniref:Alpha-ketoglutarate-dependent dioxygenase alkB homolog 4-like n=1 Tax=Hirondellea gigas TaxID=1518452 RepID=A0A2P2IAF8_9CRUS